MADSHAARMTASMLDREHAALAREAQGIADAAQRIARDVEGALAGGDIKQLLQQTQELLIRATRATAVQQTAALYEPETTAIESEDTGCEGL